MRSGAYRAEGNTLAAPSAICCTGYANGRKTEVDPSFVVCSPEPLLLYSLFDACAVNIRSKHSKQFMYCQQYTDLNASFVF
jgi:hypothetical protein